MKIIKYILLPGIVLAALFVLGLKLFPSLSKTKAQQYQFSKVSKGNIETTISSTGTLSPLTTVQVGTQVSGNIARIYADFNQQVKKGQLLAVLDTTFLKASVEDAEANLEQAQAKLEEAQNTYRQNKQLFDQKLISESDFLAAKIGLKTQEAALKSAHSALQRAQYNLKNAYIISPITGTVIARNIEEGQTVAASLSAPVLFEIAEDLSKIEILAQVDESDIGSIRDGQQVRFEVAAYPTKTFTGQVRQVRLQPTTVSNVVTYTVVINASNESGLLLPGMTAMIDFITEHQENVLRVPSAALRFSPSQEVVEAMMKEYKTRMQNRTDTGRTTFAGPDTTLRKLNDIGNRNRNSVRNNQSRIWYLDGQGKLAMIPVSVGITDGKFTEVSSISPRLKEGMQVVTGSLTEASASSNNAVTPFSGSRSSGLRGPRF